MPPAVPIVPGLVSRVLASTAAALVDNAAASGARGRLRGIRPGLDGSIIVSEGVFHGAISVVGQFSLSQTAGGSGPIA